MNDDLRALVKQIASSDNAQDDALIISQIRAHPSHVYKVVRHLQEDRSPDVRLWLVGAIDRLLPRREAVEVLMQVVSKDSHAEVRNAARTHLLSLDPASGLKLASGLVRVLERAESGSGETDLAIWTLAWLGDPDGASALRRFAGRFPTNYFEHRMALVLAESIERPDSVARRIREHDHDWMFWLVEAATLLPIPGGLEAVQAGHADPPDPECARIFADALRKNLAFRWQPLRG